MVEIKGDSRPPPKWYDDYAAILAYRSLPMTSIMNT